MPSWSEPKRKTIMPTMEMVPELIWWSLIDKAETQVAVVFYDPIEAGLVKEPQDGLW